MKNNNIPAIHIVNQNTNTFSGESSQKKSWIVALILAIFFGYLGFDRFYLGHGGLGVVKLLTMGGFGFLWMIDILLILTRSIGGIKWN